jgi:hypothetical protein
MIRNVDALRDDQWERLRDLVPALDRFNRLSTI